MDERRDQRDDERQMDELGASDLRAVIELWGEIGELSLSEGDAAWDHALEHISRLIGAERGFTAIQKRVVDDPDDPLHGFRPTLTRRFGEDAGRLERQIADWHAQKPDLLADPVLQSFTRGHGRARTLIQRRMVDEQTFERSPMRQLYEATEVEDRVISVLALTDGLEVSFGFDRSYDKERFDERERQLLAAIVGGLGSLAKGYVRTHGLMPGQRRLSPRERDVLTYMLGPLSEKEIADRLDLSAGYLHQVVVAIYRKLGVRSRAELMSLWL